MDTDSYGKTAREKRAGSASSPTRCKIDVGRYVEEMERILLAHGDRNARMQALAILERWQFDEMLEDASRQRAKLLVFRFARNGPNEGEGA